MSLRPIIKHATLLHSSLENCYWLVYFSSLLVRVRWSFLLFSSRSFIGKGLLPSLGIKQRPATIKIAFKAHFKTTQSPPNELPDEVFKVYKKCYWLVYVSFLLVIVRCCILCSCFLPFDRKVPSAFTGDRTRDFEAALLDHSGPPKLIFLTKFASKKQDGKTLDWH